MSKVTTREEALAALSDILTDENLIFLGNLVKSKDQEKINKKLKDNKFAIQLAL